MCFTAAPHNPQPSCKVPGPLRTRGRTPSHWAGAYSQYRWYPHGSQHPLMVPPNPAIPEVALLPGACLRVPGKARRAVEVSLRLVRKECEAQPSPGWGQLPGEIHQSPQLPVLGPPGWSPTALSLLSRSPRPPSLPQGAPKQRSNLPSLVPGQVHRPHLRARRLAAVRP